MADASAIFMDGFKFALEMVKADKLNDFNIDFLKKLSTDIAKQKRLIEDQVYLVDSEFVNGSTYDWYYFSIEETMTNLIQTNE